MENKFFDKLLDNVIEEASELYIEKEESGFIEAEEVQFSDTHNQKMKQLFKSVRKNENRKEIVKLAKKVAVIVLCATLITCGLVSTVEAWRKEVIKFIMKNNNDNYMSINFGDVSNFYSGDDLYAEDENKEINTYITDEIHFLYLPEGFEFKKDKNTSYKLLNFYSFINQEKYLRFMRETLEDRLKDADLEDTYNEKFVFDDKEVFKITKADKRIYYVWYDEYYLYEVLANIEEKEILKFIENVKILKNF